ncbi:MAG: PIN domain-containing protein [Candidatus Micrarchaeota archaeon]
MELVIDTNIIISAILVKSDLQKIIFNLRTMLYSPEFMLEEIEKYKDEIMERSKYSETELKELLAKIFSRIHIIPKEEYQNSCEKARKITPDEKDWPFVALGLELNCPLWANDSDLLKSGDINTITSGQLIQKLNK